ncbi:MAG: purine-binding chemotaxis protein CheW [Candidatus Desulfofervidaceae bacterium]|nr:purine-binding chemotaxis protein CheW [Candidatus Desulfofervidaceae bacterium]
MDVKENQKESFETLLEEAKTLREEKTEIKSQSEQLFLYFRLGTEYYALKMEEIREITSKMPIFKVPGCQDYILGVVNLRGEIIPVIDLKKRLNLGESTLEKDFRVIIIRIFGEPLGMVVDEIEDMAAVSEILPDEEEQLLEGKIRVTPKGSKEFKVIGVLNLKNIFFPEKSMM